ncbi:endoplasmic reticulum metallopeptidase 1, partial [Aureobasidium melanogenum]
MAPRSRNPFGFGPWVVTFFTVVVYAGLFAALIVTHHVLPPAPSTPTPHKWPGVNITQAWNDLEHLSSAYHPFNSRENVAVRKWLLARVRDILDANKVEWKEAAQHTKAALPVTVFDRDVSNVTYTDSRDYTVYYESNNIMVYVRGAEDSEDEWWLNKTTYSGPGGVLVNAHFDSVSTGFGATDDGVGVISVLQLLSHFTKQENQPHRGILFLLNNGEEDGLYGAKAFTRHPLAQFPRAFLNLEGAGAGGRATLFRSTDTEVTKFYSKSPRPFGSVISGDGFKRGLVRSGTDYSVFVDDLGMRGLDVAFMEPRARYHTNQDNARETSVESLWHLLSAA